MAPTLAPERPQPVMVALSQRPEPPREVTAIEFVNVEKTVLAGNKCSCNAGDDAPY
ncbi:hypothetical protein GCM10009679_31190 [Saccharothrix algeriensis]|uniref:Uncharacterized protein n=1 Tax=Catellatospora bangladeshensis TaxID=310355 RepID=A0A8J3JDS0_9ACTN|nr:hypothetical protein Cba03nite_44210 [Catellatospora bangladeshensis]